MLTKIKYLLIFIAIISLSSCTSKFKKILKSNDSEYKFKKAIEYYESEDYFRSMQLLDELIIIYRGTSKAEKIAYYYSYCYFQMEEYLLSSYHFKQFVKTFPRSKDAEECLFMSAYCKYEDSPVYYLDQTNTHEAIKELQLFVNLYPKSDRMKECNKLLDDLRQKLELKAYDVAKLYYKMDEYKAAIHSLKVVLKEFPDTKYKEEVLYMILKSYYTYAQKSIESKKKERYRDTIDAYNNFYSSFPESEHGKEAENIYQYSLSRIK